MATEQDPSLSYSFREEQASVGSRRGYCCPALSRLYQNTTRGHLFALPWAVAIGMPGVLVMLWSLAVPSLAAMPTAVTAYCGFYIVVEFLSRAVPALTDKLRWIRLWLSLVGGVIVAIGVCACVVFLVVFFEQRVLYPCLLVFLIQVAVALAIFHFSILQYGHDQLIFVNSKSRSSSVVWCYWSFYLLPGSALLLNQFLSFSCIADLLKSMLLSTTAAIGFVVVLSIAIHSCCTPLKEMNNVEDCQNNPIKLVWNVSFFM